MNSISVESNQTYPLVLQEILKIKPIIKNYQSQSLYYGALGNYLFNYYYAISNNKNNNIEVSAMKLFAKVEKLIQQNNFQGPGLSTGIAGYIEALNIINEKTRIFNEKKYMKDIYKVLTDVCIQLIKQHNFDYYTGAIGIINLLVKAYDRNPSLILPHINNIVASIENEKIKPSFFIQSDELDKDENGNQFMAHRPHYSNGIAHGLPAIILVLSKLIIITNSKYLRQLINKIVNIIVQYRNPVTNNAESIYLERIYEPETTKQNSYHGRLAWCYSDLTLGWAFLKAGKLLENKRLQKLGIEALEHTLIQEKTLSLSSTSHLICLCHGSAGNAYIYKRIYEETGNDQYWFAFKKWEQAALRNFKNNEIYFDQDTKRYKNDYSLMDGLMGYGLFILSIENPECNSWNSLLLLD